MPGVMYGLQKARSPIPRVLGIYVILFSETVETLDIFNELVEHFLEIFPVIL